jgi:hypothetical protein
MQKNENANELLTKRVKISYSAGFFSTCKKSSMHKNNKIEFFYEIFEIYSFYGKKSKFCIFERQKNKEISPKNEKHPRVFFFAKIGSRWSFFYLPKSRFLFDIHKKLIF